MPSADEHAAAPERWSDALGGLATRFAQLLIVAAGVALVAWLVVQLRLVVVPVLIAIMVGAAVWPLLRHLRSRGWPALPAAATTMLAGSAVLAALAWIVISGIYGEWDDLKEGASGGLEELQRLLTHVLPLDDAQFRDARQDLFAEVSGEEAKAQAATGVVVAGELAASFGLFVVVLFLLLKDGPVIWRFLRDRLPSSQRDRADRVGSRTFEVLGSYVRGTATVAMIDAVVIGLGLVVLDVPLALALGVVVFMGGFVPVVGATAAGALAALVALVSNGPVTALIVIAIVLAVNQLEGNVVAPYVLGNAVALHPLAILLALAAGAVSAGVLGALLAVPFLAVAWTIVTAWDEPAPTGAQSSGPEHRPISPGLPAPQ